MKYKILGLLLIAPLFSFLMAAFTTHNPTERQATAAVIGCAIIWLALIGVYLFFHGKD
jgi:hypothetical protein